MKTNQNKAPKEINASSMADIAFLLLIFFLVTTTMDVDKGILTLLPPYDMHNDVTTEHHKKNVLEILINSKDQLLVEGAPLAIQELKELTIKHLTNNGVEPHFSESPTKAIVSLQNDRKTSYDIYVTVQNELKAAYAQVRNEHAQAHHGLNFKDLRKEEQKAIRKIFPMLISEAEPRNFAEK